EARGGRRPAHRRLGLGRLPRRGLQRSSREPHPPPPPLQAVRPISRADALAAYQRLPIPDTTEEHWRFTNLRGFDPEAYVPQAGILPTHRNVTSTVQPHLA